ncbi:hypothetical protein HNQ80_002607 [Anaerosolibacter carboniphilus]|uniref:Uncharacterized protein n=2 Tax=Anaerosolibacter carboniphilus TaxID=1417629 RepID=A0A841L2C1_9FIRM|nr:hypothetical protein [Anaerosolibacter carboniphilus]
MSIRPIDFQSMIPKNIKLSQENQTLNNKERFEHQTLVIQDQKNTEKQLNRVNTFDRKTYPKIANQNHHKSRQERDHNSQEDKKEEQENDEFKSNEKLATGKGFKIDIMI